LTKTCFYICIVLTLMESFQNLDISTQKAHSPQSICICYLKSDPNTEFIVLCTRKQGRPSHVLSVHRWNVNISKEPIAAHHHSSFPVFHCLFHVQIKVCERVCDVCPYVILWKTIIHFGSMVWFCVLKVKNVATALFFESEAISLWVSMTSYLIT
jgi:hypothetical protein